MTKFLGGQQCLEDIKMHEQCVTPVASGARRVTEWEGAKWRQEKWEELPSRSRPGQKLLKLQGEEVVLMETGW